MGIRLEKRKVQWWWSISAKANCSLSLDLVESKNNNARLCSLAALLTPGWTRLHLLFLHSYGTVPLLVVIRCMLRWSRESGRRYDRTRLLVKPYLTERSDIAAKIHDSQPCVFEGNRQGLRRRGVLVLCFVPSIKVDLSTPSLEREWDGKRKKNNRNKSHHVHQCMQQWALIGAREKERERASQRAGMKFC